MKVKDQVAVSPLVREDSKLRVSELLQECSANTLAARQAAQSAASENEEVVFGRSEDNSKRISSLQEAIERAEDDDELYYKRNTLKNMVLTWSARFLEHRPTVRAWPGAAVQDRVRAARAANAIIQFVTAQMDLDWMFGVGADTAQCHTCVAFKPTWDSEAGPQLDEDVESNDPDDDEPLARKGDRLGDVHISMCTIFDYYTDGEQHIEDSDWVVFEKYVDLYEAREMAILAGIDPEKIESTTYVNTWGEHRSGVKLCELWHLPTARIPDGLYAVVLCDEYTVVNMAFPYEHRELPIAVFKIAERRGSPYGSTHVDDAVPIQMEINEMVSERANRTRRIGLFSRLVCREDIADQVEAGDQVIGITNAEDIANVMKWFEPPPPNQNIEAEIRACKEEIYDVFGMNEMMAGTAEIGDRTPGKAIAYMNALDAMSMSGAARSFQKMLARLFRQVLSLYQQYVKMNRIVEIAGEHQRPEAVEFSAADIKHVGIRLEPWSNVDNMRADQADEAQAAAAQGAMDPAEAEQIAETGLKSTAWEAFQITRIDTQIEDLLNGADVMPDPSIDPLLAANRIREAAQLNRNNPNVVDLLELALAYAGPGPMPAPPGQEPQPAPMDQPQAAGPGGVPLVDGMQ